MTFGNNGEGPDELLKTVPKNARSKRALDNMGPQPIENVKKALFVRGSSCSDVVTQVMQDLCALKKPESLFFGRRNEIRPFSGGKSEVSLEFFSRKNDSSLLVVGNHSKKRQHSLCFTRMFDHHILDMVEFSVVGYRSIYGIGGELPGSGLKPAMVFSGEAFEQRREYKMVQNLFLDFFHGEQVNALNLAGLESVISVTALEDRILFRVYRVSLQKSTGHLPRVELSLIGPALDLKIGRVRFPTDDMMKAACKTPKSLIVKRVKNISRDGMGDKRGRVHMGDQKLGKIQTRKVKALKTSRDKELGLNEE